MKRLLKLTLTILFCIVCAFAVVACKDVDSIAVKLSTADGSDGKTVSLVVGNDLDLSKIQLEVTDGDDKSVITLVDEGVKVSGFDKNKVGSQSVTVEYEGRVTTFTVNVVPRVSVSGYTENYFVGEEFDKTNGRVKITRDDGTSYTKGMDDANVTVEGFDSSVMTEGLQLTVRYKTDSVDYTGTFAVNVYTVEEIKLTAPKKVSYYSHDEGLNLAGGLLKVVGNNGTVTKENIAITEGMVSGFDLGAATSDHREGSALEQQLTVTYAGKTATFGIAITYTDVSEIRTLAATLSELDWAGETVPEYTKEMGENAVRAMELYYGMPAAYKTALTEEEKTLLSSTALAYGVETWFADLENYSGAIKYEEGSLTYTCDTYAGTAAAVAKLKDTANPIHKMGSVIGDIIEEYGSMAMGKNLLKCVFTPYFKAILGNKYQPLTEEDWDSYVASGYTYAYCPVYTSEEITEQILPPLQFMLDLYDEVKDAPATWTVGGTAQYKEMLDAAYAFIADSEYTTIDSASMYHCVSAWKWGAENDGALFELLYTYLYDTHTETNDNLDEMKTLSAVMLPAYLQELYDGIELASSEVASLAQGNIYESTYFLYLYTEINKLFDDLSGGEKYGAINAFFFENLSPELMLGDFYTFEYLVDYLKTTDAGYNYLVGGFHGNAQFEALLQKYVEFSIAFDKGDLKESSSDYGQKVEEMFNDFVAMSPSMQFGFISTINPYYDSQVPSLAFKAEKYYDYYYRYYGDAEVIEGLGYDDLNDMLTYLGYDSLQAMIEALLTEQGIGRNETFYYSLFAEVICKYYTGKIDSVSGDTAFGDMLSAMEYYARSTKSNANDEKASFLASLKKVTDVYATLGEDVKGIIGTAYEKYTTIAGYSGADFTATVLGDWQDEFDSLKKAIDDARTMYGLYITSGQFSNIGLMIAYERAETIVKKIVTEAPANIVNAYRYEYLYSIETQEGTTEKLTLEAAYTEILAVARREVTLLDASYDLSEDYTDALKTWLNNAYDSTVVWMTTEDLSEEQKRIIGEQIIQSLKDFCVLGSGDKLTYYMLDNYSGYLRESFYPYSISSYLLEIMTNAEAQLAVKVIDDLAYKYARYCSIFEMDTDAETEAKYKAELETVLAEVKAEYAALTDKTAFDGYFLEIYNLYVNACDDALAK